jgi:hypothetical protein
MRASVMVVATFVASWVASCATFTPSVEYVAESPSAPKPASSATIEEYELDCTTAVSKYEHFEPSRLKVFVDAAEFYGQGCYFHGGALPWSVLGHFRVPFDARDHWAQYRVALRDRARAVGCPGVAYFRDGPVEFRATDGPIGALCVGAADASKVVDPDVLPTDQGICSQTKDCPKPFTCKNGRCT